MKKTKIDKIIENMVQLTKSELDELINRLAKEHSVFLRVGIPMDKVGGTCTEGFLLKEAEGK